MGSLLIANLKLYHTIAETRTLARKVAALLKGKPNACLFTIAPSFLALPAVCEIIGTGDIPCAAQDVFWESRGAFTGEVGARQLYEAGVRQVIVGHSERRVLLGETDEMVAHKVKAIRAASMMPIVCVGETAQERDAGNAREHVAYQVRTALGHTKWKKGDRIVVAYEPRWAIGTGNACNPDTANEMHLLIQKTIREQFPSLVKPSIVYGGSITPRNVKSYLAHESIHGVLVGHEAAVFDSLKKLLAACEIV